MAHENRCSGNCMNCVAIQRQFCASQLAYNNMKAVEELGNEIKALKEKVEAMQNDATLFDPLKAEAQKGDGAEE